MCMKNAQGDVLLILQEETVCIEQAYRDANRRCLETDDASPSRNRPISVRHAERHKRLLVSSFDVPSRLCEVVDMKKKKIFHEYASFMLTDTKIKQKEGTIYVNGDGKSRRCSSGGKQDLLTCLQVPFLCLFLLQRTLNINVSFYEAEIYAKNIEGKFDQCTQSAGLSSLFNSNIVFTRNKQKKKKKTTYFA